MKKKFLLSVFSFILIISFYSCGNSSRQKTKMTAENEKMSPTYQVKDFRFAEATMEDDYGTCKMQIDAPEADILVSTILIDSETIEDSWPEIKNKQGDEKRIAFLNIINDLENKDPEQFSLEVMDKKITRLSVTDDTGEKIIFRSM